MSALVWVETVASVSAGLSPSSGPSDEPGDTERRGKGTVSEKTLRRSLRRTGSE